jgi:hypothetical protein
MKNSDDLPSFFERNFPSLNTEDEYHILTEVCNTAKDFLSSEESEILNEIKSNTSMEPNERILKITKRIAEQMREQSLQLEKVSSEFFCLQELSQKSDMRVLRILSFCEEELHFIQSLIRSRDLQEIVFLKPELNTRCFLSYDDLNELVKKVFPKECSLKKRVAKFQKKMSSNHF